MDQTSGKNSKANKSVAATSCKTDPSRSSMKFGTWSRISQTKSSILICGGCGYIGSHAVLELLRQQIFEVIVIDNLSTGHKNVINKIESQVASECVINERKKKNKIKFYKGNICDSALLDKVFTDNKIFSVMHFCASSLVGESMKDPLKYYQNNVIGTYSLVSSMIKHKVYNLIFSSTAAVYGEPKEMPIVENIPLNPTNTYGATKLAVEQMLYFTALAHPEFKYVSFRYFNASGADKSGCLKEDHQPETHLIPIVLQVASGKREKIYIFGNDYKTSDGTCFRDYVHVSDIISAHLHGIDYILSLDDKTMTDKPKIEIGITAPNGSTVFNLGTGSGYSVKQVIETSRKVTDKNIMTEDAPRRLGDPPALIASNKKARHYLGWNRIYRTLESIIETAWYSEQ